jgi:hypothetical protein
MVMIIEDLKVDDTATYYYNIWGQQVLVRGKVIEILEDSVIFSNDKSKYLHKIPKNHLISRDKRPEEIEEEKRKTLTKKVEADFSNKFKYLSGVILIDRDTKQELNSAMGSVTPAWVEIESKRKEEIIPEPIVKVKEVIEHKQEKWRNYDGKHRNQTDESRSESR